MVLNQSIPSSIDVQSSPIVLPPLDARIGQTHIDPADICHEWYIRWLREPLDLPYIREDLAIRTSRTARIGSAADKNLLGYSVLMPNAPPIRGCRGVWWRRVFRIAEPYDREIVDPQTIDIHKPGRITGKVLIAMGRGEHGEG